jgi:hypothetical protein
MSQFQQEYLSGNPGDPGNIELRSMLPPSIGGPPPSIGVPPSSMGMQGPKCGMIYPRSNCYKDGIFVPPSQNKYWLFGGKKMGSRWGGRSKSRSRSRKMYGGQQMMREQNNTTGNTFRRGMRGGSFVPYSPSVWTEPGKFPSAVGGQSMMMQQQGPNVSMQRQSRQHQMQQKLTQRRSRQTQRRRQRRRSQRRSRSRTQRRR